LSTLTYPLYTPYVEIFLQDTIVNQLLIRILVMRTLVPICSPEFRTVRGSLYGFLQIVVVELDSSGGSYKG